MIFLLRWLISTLAIIITAYLLPAVIIDSLVAALVAALVLGLINVTLKPLLIILTLPINILTLGLLTLVINALMILLTSWLVPGFQVHGFWWAMLFSVVMSLVNYFLSQILND